MLGLGATGGRAKTYADLDPFKGSATEVAKRLGASRGTVFNIRKKMRRPSEGKDSPADS